MPDLIAQIAEAALAIDRKAAAVYARLRDGEEEPELGAFWGRMSHEEADHVRFWEALLAPGHAPLPAAFDDPRGVLEELRHLDDRTGGLLDRCRAGLTRAEAFLIAYRLEFYLLHPAFAVFFREAPPTLAVPSPDALYKEHIQAFIDACRRYAGDDPGLALAGEILVREWRENRAAAQQGRRLRGLQGLLPICSGCKKIRDGDGAWHEVEAYVGARTDADFTHGICPGCIERLYPEFARGGGNG